MQYRIYSDGACLENPNGPGGWGAVVCREDDRGNVEHLWETGGAEDPTTNNRMELRAALEGLLKLAELPGVRNVNVRVLSDSKYVIGAMTLWVRNWKRNGWKTNSHEPVKNQDLIEELDQLQNWFHNFPTWVWVKGHAGNVGNENADRIAGDHAIGRPPVHFEGPVGQHPSWGGDRGVAPWGTRPTKLEPVERQALREKPLTTTLEALVTKPKKPCAILLPTSLEVKALAKRTGKGTRKAYFWLLAEKQKGQTLPLFPEGAV